MKFKSLLAMMFLAGGLLVGCQNNTEEPATDEPDTVEEVADAGAEEEVEVEEVRIVAGTVAGSNVLGELNAEVIGIPTTTSPIPEQFAGLPEVGISHSPDLEIVASLEPDLFVVDANFRENLEGSLNELGINTFFFETVSFSIFLESIENLGAEIHREEEAATLIQSLEDSIAEVADMQTEDAPTVAIIFGAGDNAMLATGASYLGELASLAGATNIASELEGGLHAPFLPFSFEQIVVANPDYILRFAPGEFEANTEMFEQMFAESDALQQLDAVQNGNVIDLNPALGFGVSANINAPTAVRTLGEIFYGVE